jgi:hypothetical protein
MVFYLLIVLIALQNTSNFGKSIRWALAIIFFFTSDETTNC